MYSTVRWPYKSPAKPRMSDTDHNYGYFGSHLLMKRAKCVERHGMLRNEDSLARLQVCVTSYANFYSRQAKMIRITRSSHDGKMARVVVTVRSHSQFQMG